jgi:hypothetical protein
LTDRKHEQMREFVGTVVQKLPLPSRFVIKKGYFTKQLGLVFVCSRTRSKFTVATTEWARWLKVSIPLAKAGKAVFDSGLGAGTDIFEQVQVAYSAYRKRDDEDFNTFIEQPFLLAAERDRLVAQLRSSKDANKNFGDQTSFEVFQYDTQTGSWYMRESERPLPHNYNGAVVSEGLGAAARCVMHATQQRYIQPYRLDIHPHHCIPYNVPH